MIPPYHISSVRSDWHAGAWRYALGRPAEQHPQYYEAVALAETGECSTHCWWPRNQGQFNPWWIRTWSDVNAVLDGCYMDRARGERICNFFEKVLRHSKAGLNIKDQAGRKVELMDWHRWDILMPLFGWMRPNGRRRFKKASIWVPKKNAKSFMSSGIGLFLLTKDGEETAEVYSAAGSRDQAGIIHDESARMVRMSPALSSRLTCIPSTKSILFYETASKFKALASEAGLQEGLNWSALLFDEVHVQRDRLFFDTLVYGGISRAQPLLVETSTAGVYDPLSIGWEEFEVARHVYDGTVKNWETFVYIASAHSAKEKESMPWVLMDGDDITKDDDFMDPRVHKKANPAIDITISAADLATQAKAAYDNPREQNRFKRYRLNMWTNQASRLIAAHHWAACADTKYADKLTGRMCIGGLDLSLSNDLTSLGLWFPPIEPGEPHKTLSWYWLPRENIADLERQNKAPYREWAEQGLIELTEGDTIDYSYIRERVDLIMGQYELKEIGFDPYNANETQQALRMKYGDEFMIAVRQGWLTMGPATKFVNDKILRKDVLHPNHPITNWHVSNAQAIYDKAGNYMIIKGDGKVRFKIDGLVALIIAASRVMSMEQEKTSVYETRGVLQV